MDNAASPADLDALGVYALRYVKPGQTLGLGTGRAASAFIRALGEAKIKVRGVPTSHASEALARSLGILAPSTNAPPSVSYRRHGPHGS